MLRLSVFCLALLTAACGWQLRGTVGLSSEVDTLYLTGEDRFSPLMTELRNQLRGADIALTDSPIGAQYTLRITREQSDRRVAGLGTDALASAYEMTLRADFDVLGASSTVLASGLSSNATRSYHAPAAGSGGGGGEEDLILGEMRQELSQQILRQLQAVISAAQARGDEPAPVAPQTPTPTTTLDPTGASPEPEAPDGEASP